MQVLGTWLHASASRPSGTNSLQLLWNPELSTQNDRPSDMSPVIEKLGTCPQEEKHTGRIVQVAMQNPDLLWPRPICSVLMVIQS